MEASRELLGLTATGSVQSIIIFECFAEALLSSRLLGHTVASGPEALSLSLKIQVGYEPIRGRDFGKGC